MGYTKILLLIIVLFTILFFTCSQKKDLDDQLADFFNKKEVTILVTDSGLGGLSVAADVAARLPKNGIFENARIVFFNSLFHNRSGYNSLDSEDEKVRIFDTALEGMQQSYKPDLLLIACNTLSVIYHKTKFAQSVSFPVIGIVETGVDLIAEQFEKTPNATCLIFATKTTIGSETHKNLLIKKGYSGDQIVGQACHRLAGSIERGYDSEETINYLKGFVPQALEKRNNPNTPIFVSLNCTHYGYSINQFKEVFASVGYPDIEVIDPNPKMADFLFHPEYLNRYQKTNVSVEVVSKVKVSKQEIESLSGLLKLTSQQTAESFRNYQYDWNLFDSKFDSTKIKN